MIGSFVVENRSLRRLLCLALLLTALSVTAGSAQAQRVRAYVTTDSVTVGDRFQLIIVAEHDLPAAPTFPPSASDSLFGDLTVLGQVALGTRRVEGGIRHDSIVYEVTTFALDTAYVPPLRVYFSENEDLSAASLPLIVPVTSLVPPDATDIKDLAPLFEFPQPWWPYLLLLLALLLLGGLLYYYLRTRRHAPEAEPEELLPIPEISPYEAALQRLRKLDEVAEHTLPDDTKPFYIELSEALRTYLEERIGVPALETTTRELVRDLAAEGVRYRLPEDAPRRINTVLEQADLVKFADIIPRHSQNRTTLDETRKMVDLIEAKLRRIYAETQPERTTGTPVPAGTAE